MKQKMETATKKPPDPSRAYGRALTRSMKYWAIWDELSEQGKGDTKEALDAKEKYLQAEHEMACLCSA